MQVIDANPVSTLTHIMHNYHRIIRIVMYSNRTVINHLRIHFGVLVHSESGDQLSSSKWIVMYLKFDYSPCKNDM